CGKNTIPSGRFPAIIERVLRVEEEPTAMSVRTNYRHTQYACYLGYITQAIVNNLAPLLFVIFQDVFAISLEKITLLVTGNFCLQLLVDLVAARFVDKIGYRPCVVAAHLFAAAGLVGMGIFPC